MDNYCKASEWKPSASFKTVFMPKALSLLHRIDDDPKLLHWCRHWYAESREAGQIELDREIIWFIEASYEEGLVVTDYLDYIGFRDKEFLRAEQTWVDGLSFEKLLAAIAAHFRRDHHCNGSLQEESIPSGAMLRLFEELNKRLEKAARYIRYTFVSCPLRVPGEPVSKTVTRIFTDGIVEIKEYEDRKVVSFVRKKVKESEVQDLLKDISDFKGGPVELCDAMSYAAIVYDDGTVKRYPSSPVCLDEFVSKLQYNSSYVLII